MPKPKNKNADLLAQLGKAATEGTAGKAQAERATSKKPSPPATKAPKKKTPTKTGIMGKPVSTYLHDTEIASLLSLVGKLATNGTEANRTHLVRAGILALNSLPEAEVAQLVEEVKSTDGRRK